MTAWMVVPPIRYSCPKMQNISPDKSPCGNESVSP